MKGVDSAGASLIGGTQIKEVTNSKKKQKKKTPGILQNKTNTHKGPQHLHTKNI